MNTELATAEENKQIYGGLHDTIIDKRFRAASPIRRYAHQTQYQIIADMIPDGAQVLDAGAGEGVLCVLLAKKGCIVTGIDLSEPNIAAAKKYAEEEGVADKTTFLLGDAENLPVEDQSFDYVVSSHVLEHLPDFVKGAAELNRVARKKVIAAIPTCLNLSACVLLGGDKYWTISRRTLYALPYGILRVIVALVTGKEGVNEGYEGRMELIHIFRFPWRGASLLRKGGLHIDYYRCSAHPIPYLPFLVPLSRLLDHFSRWPIIRNFGYGTTYVCTPSHAS